MSLLPRLLTLTAVVAAGFLVAACATNQMTAASPDVLRIGVTANSPPMIYKAGGQISGLDADLARSLAAEMGRTPVFVERKWDQLLPSLQAGEFDIIMSNMTITNERKMFASFTTPYLQVGQMILIRANEFGFYQNPEIIALVDKKIGVEAGTVSDSFLQQYCAKAIRVPLKNPDQAISALTSGRIDAFLGDAPVIWGLSARGASQGVTRVPTPLGSEYLGWAVRRGDTAMLNTANATIAKWRKNGQLAKMVNRWMPMGR